MPGKPTIAVDIDDVLADNAKAFVEFSNKRWGTHLTIEDYSDHWGEMWRIDHAEVERRAVEFHLSGSIGEYEHNIYAKPVLLGLAENYRLIIITARRQVVVKETEAWLDTYFKDVFDKVIYAGFYDNERLGFHLTKAELCHSEGVNFLIDDQLKHCLGAAEIGVQALLFGNYGWNRTDTPLPSGVRRVVDWQAVKEFFDAERS